MEQFVFGLVYIIHCILWFHKNMRNLNLYSLDKLCSEQQCLSRYLLTKSHQFEKKYTNAGVGGGDKHQLKMMKPYLTTGSEGDDEGRD